MSAPAERFLAIRQAVDHLEQAVTSLVAHTDRPVLENKRFRFPVPSAQIVQLCKAVRVVSTLNACLDLLPRAQYAEILMLLRCAFDYLGEIVFLHEAVTTGEPTADQQRFIDHFFEEYGGETAEEIVANPPRGSVVERKKIQASQGRQLTPEDPHSTQKTGLAIDAVMSGYVHGSYQSTMELYEGGTWRFRMRGMMNTPRALEAEMEIVICTHRALNMVRGIGWSMQNEWVFDSCRAARLEFEQSAACEGMNLTVPSDGTGENGGAIGE